MISRIPGVNLYAQYPAWADGASGVPRRRSSTRSSRTPSVCAGAGAPRKVVVSLGTFKDYRVPSVWSGGCSTILPPDVEVLWQTGDTDVSGLGHRRPPRDP